MGQLSIDSTPGLWRSPNGDFQLEDGITSNVPTLLGVIGINFLMLILSFKIIPIISLFGAFFLISMLAPLIYFILWIFQFAQNANSFLDAGWPLTIFTYLFSLTVVILLIVNIAMNSWNILVRFSKLYFRFPRVKAAWAQADKVSENYQPFVSIHVPCYSEPPAMVIETLNALALLDYENYEVIVLDNNTTDINLWKPVEEHCRKLGKHFRFFHFDRIKGAKAGALNKALTLTAPQAELIAVLDSDYSAKSDFLKKLVRFFADPKIGFVQSLQNYRHWENSRYQTACYYEYQDHFELVLPGQNEWDASYTIGTMCILRRKAMEEVGGWAEWCLTEDSEIAVRIHALGYAGYYLGNTFGKGLIPLTFEEYKKQHFRWSAGPVQQFQKHWKLYMPWSTSLLTPIQKIAESFHSLSVFFSQSLNLIMNVIVLGICLFFSITQGKHFIVPLNLLIWIPILILHNMALNIIQIRILGGNYYNYLGASLAARSLVFTRILAFYKALFCKNLAWKRTEKFQTYSNLRRASLSCWPECIAALIYIVLIAAIAPFGSYLKPDIICLIMLSFANQAFTYLCAPMMALLSEYDLTDP